MNRTTTAKPDTITREWHLVDATNQPIGRLAAQVAQVIRGKHKPTFTPNMDCGDFVVVVNASKAVWTGTKGKELVYRHSGWPGGLKSTSREDFLAEQPEELIRKVVWGMLPKGALGKDMIKKLKVYAGEEHPHAAQGPKPMSVSKK
ncbi:MAG TPA: 50S ribosomal protein L13 [Fimbriimonadaceae bacterium]|nr:50S ribosomal protein L13 [Fimbriimonadaceae bacterium]